MRRKIRAIKSRPWRTCAKHSAWTWVYCDKCLHHAPVAFVPLMIRWGANASSDKLRRCARCTACGHKGATLQHPGWVDAVVGFQPFPDMKHHQ